MGTCVVVFSPDAIRGNIVSRKLQREGFKVKLFDRAVTALESVVSCNADVLVFDTAGCMPDELRTLSRFCTASLPEETTVIGLGEAGESLSCLRGPDNGQTLSGPLDPERIAAVVLEACTPAKQQGADFEDSRLQDDLKTFLRLR